MTDTDLVLISVRLPRKLLETIDNYAKENRLTRTYIIKRCLTHYVFTVIKK